MSSKRTYKDGGQGRRPDTKRPGSAGRATADGVARPELEVLIASEEDTPRPFIYF